MQTHDHVNLHEILEEPDAISPADVLRFRREVFGDGVVSRHEAEAVFALNDRTTQNCAEWNEFFIEALTDYTVMQAEPSGYVSNANATWLVNRISHDGVVDSITELELLVRVLARSKECPPALAGFALAQVAHAVIVGDGPLARGMKLTRGMIGEAEVDLLRTVLYAAGGANGLSISRQEAEILFDINDRTDAERNHPSWQDLFVRATANYLMAMSMPTAPSRAEALARQEWLDDAETDHGGFLGQVFGGIGNVFSEGFFDDVFTSSHVQMERAWGKQNREREQEIPASEVVDAGEAGWLVERIRRDGATNANERALLAFLKRESSHIDPRVQELIEEVAA